MHEYWHNLAMTIVGVASILSAAIVFASITLMAASFETRDKKGTKWGAGGIAIGILLCIFIWPLAAVMNVF